MVGVRIPSPCGCWSLPLQKGAELVALVDMMLTAMTGTWPLYLLVGTCIKISTAEGEEREYDRNTTAVIIAILVWGFTVKVGQVVLGFILFHGAKQKNMNRCRLWFAASMVFFGLSLARLMYNVWMLKHTLDLDLAPVVSSVLPLPYYVYALWVVRAFMDEVERERVPNSLTTKV